MRYGDAEAFRAALEARLRQAATGDQDLARRRRTVAFDRFLARLAVSQGGAWILKGGAALEFRMPDGARTTRDIDLAFTDSVDPSWTKRPPPNRRHRRRTPTRHMPRT